MSASEYKASMGRIINVQQMSYREPIFTVERIYTMYISSGEKPLPEKIRVGAIQGGYNDAYNGVLKKQMQFEINGDFLFGK